MKKFTALTLSFVLLAACNTAPSESPVEETVELEAPTEEEEIIYINDDYKFSLSLPMNWESYTVTDRELDWGEAGMANSYDFGFEDFSLMNLSIHSLEQWETIASFEGPMPTELGRTDDIVIGGSGSHDAPDEYLDQRMAVPEILETFEWL